MNSPTIEERLATLERKNRHWRWAACGSTLGLLLVVGLGASGGSGGVPKSIAAEEFRVVKDGKTLALLASADDKPTLLLTDGRLPRLIAEVNKEGDAVLHLFAKGMDESLTIGGGTEPQVTVRGGEGAAGLFGVFKGTPRLAVLDRRGVLFQTPGPKPQPKAEESRGETLAPAK